MNEVKQAHIIIQEVNILKSGVTKRGKWNLYQVVGQNEEKFLTFDEKYAGMINDPILIHYEERVKEGENRTFRDNFIVEPPKLPAKPIQEPYIDQEVNKITTVRIIDEKVIELLEKIERNTRPVDFNA